MRCLPTDRALELLETQLEELARVVPQAAVAELQKVPLWVSPEYPGVKPKAEYHPDADWLRKHGRNPAMAQSVEFTNVRSFEPVILRCGRVAAAPVGVPRRQRLSGGGRNAPSRSRFW